MSTSIFVVLFTCYSFFSSFEMFSTFFGWKPLKKMESSTWIMLLFDFSYFKKWRITGSKHWALSIANSFAAIFWAQQRKKEHVYCLLGVMDHIHLWQPFIVCQTDNFLHKRSCNLKSYFKNQKKNAWNYSRILNAFEMEDSDCSGFYGVVVFMDRFNVMLCFILATRVEYRCFLFRSLLSFAFFIVWTEFTST